MRYSSRFWLYAPLCLFLALTGWVSLHWWNVASALNKKMDGMKGREAMPGITIGWQTKTLSGFPFNIDVVFTGLSVKGAGAHGPFLWESEKFALHTLTYERQKQVLEAGGPQHLAWTDREGGAHDIRFLPGALHGSAVFAGRSLVRFDLDVLDASGENADGAAFTARRLQLHIRRDPKSDGLDLVASADSVKGAAIVPPVGEMKVTGVLKRGAALAGLLRGEISWPRASADWRKQDSGVSFDFSGLTAGQSAMLEKQFSGLY